MTNILNNLAVILIIASALGLVVLSFLDHKKFINLRKLAAFSNLRKAIGLAIEQGKRLHISLGNSDLQSRGAAASFIGLSALEDIAHQSSLSDKPPYVTSGNGDLSILSQDIMYYSLKRMNAIDYSFYDRVYLTGPTPYAYIAGTMPVILGEKSSTNLLTGNFGSEIALLTDSANRRDSFSFAASQELQGQATIFACADEGLIGEELFAIPAHLSEKPVNKASLIVQDALRWIFIITIIIGAFLKLLRII